MCSMEKGNEEERLMRLPRVTWKGYAALLFAILFFAGIFASVQSAAWLRAFDFSTLIGKFGTMASDKATFVGMGGASARGGFLFALSLVPSVMLAVGCVEVLSHFGALAAAQRLMTPLLKPLMDVPGFVGLTLITDMQSTDAGAALTKELYDEKLIDKREQTIIAAWQYSGAGMINNYFAIVGALFSYALVPIIVPLLIIFVLKFFGAVVCRIVLDTVYKGDFGHEQ